MGRPAASLLVPSLPVYLRTCVFLVHACAVGQASRLVSRLPYISTSVSIRALAPILSKCNHNASLTIFCFFFQSLASSKNAHHDFFTNN